MKRLVEILKKIYHFPQRTYRYLLRVKYLKELQSLIPSEYSIISSNCMSGRICQDLKREYNSPTAGLFFYAEDFVKFVAGLKENLKREVIFIPQSKYKIANEKMKRRKCIYPIGQLKDTDIEIHFLHYHSEKDALEKWNRRCSRIKDKIFVIGMEQNLPNKEIVKKFSELPLKNKVYFCTSSCQYDSSIVNIKEFSHLEEVANPYTKAHIYYRYLVNYLKMHPLS